MYKETWVQFLGMHIHTQGERKRKREREGGGEGAERRREITFNSVANLKKPKLEVIGNRLRICLFYITNMKHKFEKN